MNWTVLEDDATLDQIIKDSYTVPQLIFKHSTRCSISTVAKSRLDKADLPENAVFYYLDLIRYRDLSNKVANIFKVEHESPQVLLIKDGNCVYTESHMGIFMEDIVEKI